MICTCRTAMAKDEKGEATIKEWWNMTSEDIDAITSKLRTKIQVFTYSIKRCKPWLIVQNTCVK